MEQTGGIIYPKGSEDVKKKIAEGQWTTGLYDCCDDPSVCFLTCFCPCVTFGRIAEIVDKGETSCGLAGLISVAMTKIGCGWLHASIYRAKLRRHFSLPEEPCSDAVVHCFCCGCALCQEHRELVHRGANPSLGWQGNAEKWKKEGITQPIVAPVMER